MNKKLIVGVTSVSLFGATVVGSLIGAFYARKNAVQSRLKAIEEAKKSDANLLESEKISKKSGVQFFGAMSLVSPNQAKIAFTIPAKYTGQTLTLFYKPTSSILAPQSITLTTSQTTTEQNISFLFNTLPATLYEYQLTLASSPTEALFYSQLRSSKMPLLTASGAFRAANLSLSDLDSYKSKSLVLKAVEKTTFENSGINAFNDAFLTQEVLINSKEDKKLVWFKPAGNAVIKDNVEYVVMLFDERGLVPLLATPVNFTTTLNKVEVSNVQTGVKVANFTISNLKPYEGKELIIAYKKVPAADSFFRPIDNTTVQQVRLAIPTFAADKEASLIVELKNLLPESIYKLQIFDAADTNLTDDFLVNPATIITKKQPKVEANLDGQANPTPEAHAAYLKVTNFSDYMDKTTGVLTGLSIKFQKKPTSGNLLAWNNVDKANSIDVKNVTPGEIYAGVEILGLEPATAYVYQLFTESNAEPLLETNQEFVTKVGLTVAGVVPTVPVGTSGQTSATITFTGQELAQFFVENGNNELELRYAEEPTPVTTAASSGTTSIPKVDWTAANIQKLSTTITRTAAGAFSAQSFNLAGLSAGKKYLYAIFVGPNKLADVMIGQSASFLTRETVNATTVALSTKAVLYTNSLASYVGSKYEITYKEKVAATTPPADPAPADTTKTLAPATIGTNGVIEATLGSTTDPLSASKEYEYTISIVGDDNVKTQLITGSVTTKASQFSLSIPNNKIYPTSVEVSLTNLEGLKNQDLQLVYRKKGETAYSVAPEIFKETTSNTKNQFLNSLQHLTEYEFNVVLKNAATQPLADTWASAITKDVAVLTSSEVMQTSFKVSYAKVDTYAGETLILRYWKSQATGDAVETVPSDASKYQTMNVVVTQSDAVISAAMSTLTGLDPQSKYSFQLFKSNVAVSHVNQVTTANQVRVSKVEAYISSANIILSNLSTISGDASEQLVLVLYELTDANSTTEPSTNDYSSSVNSVEFTKGTTDTQNVLIEGLTKDKNFVLQVFRKSDRSFSTPLITTKLTNSDDGRKFALLNNSNTPVVKVAAVARTSAVLEIDNLDQFKGQKLVLKYKSSYWGQTKEIAFTVPMEKANASDAKIKTFVTLTDLINPDQSATVAATWNYEVYVDVNGNSSKVQLIGATSKPDVKTSFTTNGPASAKSVVALSTSAKLKFTHLKEYATNPENQKLVVKAIPKRPNVAVDWNATEGVVVSTVVTASKTSLDDNSKELEFELTGLNPNTEYVYQLFVETLTEPILKIEQTFKTKDLITVSANYVANTATKLLLSNMASYNGETLQITYTTGSTSKTWEITVSDSSFTNQMVIPLLLEELTENSAYTVNVKMLTSGPEASVKTWSNNILPMNLSFTTAASTKLGLVLSNSATTQGANVILGGEGTNTSLGSLNYLKGRTLVFSYVDATSSDWTSAQSIEFTIPTNYSENSFTLPGFVTGLTASGTKSFKVKLVDKHSEFTKEVNFFGTTEVKFAENATTLSTLTAKTGKSAVNATQLSSVSTKETWEAHFDLQTLTGYTVTLEAVNVNVEQNHAILTLNFNKDNVKVSQQFTIAGWATPTAASTTVPAPVARIN